MNLAKLMEPNVSDVKCQSRACDQHPTMHFTRVEARRAVEVLNLCDSHSKLHFREHYNEYCSPLRIGQGRPLTVGNGVAFDIDFVFFDELQEPRPWGRCHVELLEVGGQRRLGFDIGVSECGALDRELQGYPSPRPMTHHAMAGAISSLGGRLQYVEIDKFYPPQRAYEAKLHVQQMNSDVVVDLRPSDGLVLAVISGVPIIVSNDVLRALAETQQIEGVGPPAGTMTGTMGQNDFPG